MYFKIEKCEDKSIYFSDGEFCAFCENFSRMAAPNVQYKGKKVFVCWGCRASNKWKLDGSFD